ncbi:putative harbinger transposase-derived nuclease [Abeliophyllum distichum]|uniref:Harbinger transposase-derived nuclease n=1 Tax=Abeliophyllum distichum TaxID=126358 RepID=A0ABD1SY81_9LAMI
MSGESVSVHYLSDDDLTTDDSSDDDFVLADDVGDILMLSYFVANDRSIMDMTPCRASLLTGKIYCADQFYLVDSVYPNMPGFLTPSRGRRYHLRDYSGHGRLCGKEELFNYRHSSCRNIIERCIGVLKTKFPNLKFITNYPLSRQRQIPTACCTIHNFIRREHVLDSLFAQYSSENMVFEDVPESSQDHEVIQFDANQTAQMGQVRDQIATLMWNDYSMTHT